MSSFGRFSFCFKKVGQLAIVIRNTVKLFSAVIYMLKFEFCDFS